MPCACEEVSMGCVAVHLSTRSCHEVGGREVLDQIGIVRGEDARPADASQRHDVRVGY
jgi:hypothetical protein